MWRIVPVTLAVVLCSGWSLLSAPGVQTLPALDPTIVDPAHFKTEFENEYVRVIRIKPERGHLVTHAHPAPGAVVVALSDAELRLTTADGTSRLISYKAGDARWSVTTEPHQDEVTSDRPVELIRIEPKLRR